MSYEIQHSRKAYKYETERCFGTQYLAFSMEASNNVSPRTPGPRVIGIGSHYSVIGDICRDAANIESGCLKGRSITTPEAYIASWRKVLKAAKPLEELNGTLRLAVSTPHFAGIMENHDTYYREEIYKFAKEFEQIDFCGEKIKEIKLQTNPAGIEAYSRLYYVLKKTNMLYYRGFDV